MRIDRPGVPLADFHTTGGGLPRGRTVPTAEAGRRAEGKATIVTRRMYLSDAVFTVAVQGTGGLVGDLDDALRSPHWQPYLGRRSCPPDHPLLLRTAVDDPVQELYRHIPLPAQRPDEHGQIRVDIITEEPAGATGTLTEVADVPVTFSRYDRRHQLRTIRRERAALPGSLARWRSKKEYRARPRRIRKEAIVTAWLTQIIPDYRNEQVREDLRDVVAMHKRVMTLVPDGLGDQARLQAGVLYRIDESARGTRILIQTRIHPGLSRLPSGYGQAETRELGPLLAWLSPGAVVRYRITANTCKRKSHSTKVIALRGAAADEWWTSRAPSCGLGLQSLFLIHLTTPSAARTGRPASAMLSRGSTGSPPSPIPAPCEKPSWPESAAANPTAAGCSASRRSPRAARPHERRQHLACGDHAATDAPHTRGDDPPCIAGRCQSLSCSPHARG